LVWIGPLARYERIPNGLFIGANIEIVGLEPILFEPASGFRNIVAQANALDNLITL
jgi:hypothetical protein